MRAAIMGAGSLGMILGAYIAKAGRQCDLIDTYEAHVEALNSSGAKVVGKAEFTVPVIALTPQQMQGTYDLIILLTKQTYNDAVLASLEPHLHEKSILCTLQNGLPEPALADRFGAERVMGAAVGWGATFHGPGVSELTSEIPSMAFYPGRTDGKVTDELKEVQALLECMCPAPIQTNLLGIRWSKLAANATLSGMSAALGCTFGQVMEDEDSLRFAKHVMNECIQITAAAGIHMEEMEHFDLNRLGFTNLAEREDSSALFRAVAAPHKLLRASMLQDLEKGRPCEIAAINGVVCDMGRRYGVPTPANDQVVETICGIEQGKYPIAFSNIRHMILPQL